MGARAHGLFLSIFIFAQLMDMILHRKADYHREGLQYKPFAVAAGSSAAKGGGRGSGTQSQQVASCLDAHGACWPLHPTLTLAGLMPPRGEVGAIKPQPLQPPHAQKHPLSALCPHCPPDPSWLW